MRQMAIRDGDLRHDIDLETTTDILYGPIYYRLVLGTGAITDAFIDRLYEQFMAGHMGASPKRSGAGTQVD
jgi:hypothetical protein